MGGEEGEEGAPKPSASASLNASLPAPGEAKPAPAKGAPRKMETDSDDSGEDDEESDGEAPEGYNRTELTAEERAIVGQSLLKGKLSEQEKANLEKLKQTTLATSQAQKDMERLAEIRKKREAAAAAKANANAANERAKEQAAKFHEKNSK